MSDFERSRLEVRGRRVVVTSWLDPESHTWKAGAPGVTLDSKRSALKGYPSRKEALAQVEIELSTHFQAWARGITPAHPLRPQDSVSQ